MLRTPAEHFPSFRAGQRDRDAEIAECEATLAECRRMNQELIALVQRDTDALAEALKEIERLREAVRDIDSFIGSPRTQLDEWKRWSKLPAVRRALSDPGYDETGGFPCR